MRDTLTSVTCSASRLNSTRRLRSDLDAIMLTAMRQDPSERYGSSVAAG